MTSTTHSMGVPMIPVTLTPQVPVWFRLTFRESCGWVKVPMGRKTPALYPPTCFICLRLCLLVLYDAPRRCTATATHTGPVVAPSSIDFSFRGGLFVPSNYAIDRYRSVRPQERVCMRTLLLNFGSMGFLEDSPNGSSRHPLTELTQRFGQGHLAQQIGAAHMLGEPLVDLDDAATIAAATNAYSLTQLPSEHLQRTAGRSADAFITLNHDSWTSHRQLPALRVVTCGTQHPPTHRPR